MNNQLSAVSRRYYGKYRQKRHWLGIMLRKSHRPTAMILDISGACNAKCPFCPRIFMPDDRQSGFMSREVFLTALNEAKKNNITDIRLYATSEPTLHPSFDDYVDVLKTQGFSVSVSTNASTLKKHYDSLSRVDFLKYSIEGWDKESYERYRFPLRFEKVYDGIAGFWDFAAALNHRPKIHVLLLAVRAVNVRGFFDLWAPYVDRFDVGLLLNTTRFDGDRFVSGVNPALSNEYFTPVYSPNACCAYPFEVLTVSFDGKIALCCEDFAAGLDLGDINDGAASIFSSSVIKDVRKQFYPGNKKTVCVGCNKMYKPAGKDKEWVNKQLSELPEIYTGKWSYV